MWLFGKKETKFKDSKESKNNENFSVDEQKKIDTLKTLDLPYNFDELGVLDTIKGNNIKQAINDIMTINEFFEEAHEILPKMPLFSIKETDIKFSAENFLKVSETDFSYLKLQPFTNTGKIAKYPLTLYFNTLLRKKDKRDIAITDDLFGELFYLKGGEIGKIHIVRWFNSKCYIIDVSKDENNILCVRQIETNNPNGGKDIIYKRDVK